MQKRNFAFLVLLVLAAFLITYGLLVQTNFKNHKFGEHPKTVGDCPREILPLCLSIAGLQLKNESKVSPHADMQTQSATIKVTPSQKESSMASVNYTSSIGTTRKPSTAANLDADFVRVKGRMKLKISQDRQKLIELWKSCPKPGLGLDSTFITADVDGRLGNIVWAYLSVLAAAKRHGLRPIFNEYIFDLLCDVFNQSSMSVPTCEEMENKCGMNYFSSSLADNKTFRRLDSRKDLFNNLLEPVTEGYRYLKFSAFVASSEDTIPFWHELKDEMVLKGEYLNNATRIITQITEKHSKYLDEVHNSTYPSRIFEYVGVHARKTDYEYHLVDIHPGAELADERYYSKAMDWMAKTLKNPPIFIVVSDDLVWANVTLVSNRKDAYLGGNGDEENPGIDLALLGACNHTIFSYGTFGLTGALLADTAGGQTIMFDTRNKTITKEMEFGGNLPGWRIMDNEGKFNYQEKLIKYRYFLKPEDKNKSRK